MRSDEVRNSFSFPITPSSSSDDESLELVSSPLSVAGGCTARPGASSPSLPLLEPLSLSLSSLSSLPLPLPLPLLLALGFARLAGPVAAWLAVRFGSQGTNRPPSASSSSLLDPLSSIMLMGVPRDGISIAAMASALPRLTGVGAIGSVLLCSSAACFPRKADGAGAAPTAQQRRPPRSRRGGAICWQSSEF